MSRFSGRNDSGVGVVVREGRVGITLATIAKTDIARSGRNRRTIVKHGRAQEVSTGSSPREPTQVAVSRHGRTGVAEDVDDDGSAVRGAPVFPEVYALPRPKAQPAIRYGDAQVYGGQGGPDVRWHVIGSFDRVFEQPIAVGYESIEEALEVRADIGIGIFLNDERRGRVLEVQGAQAGPNACQCDLFLDVVRDVIEPASSRRDAKPAERLTEHVLIVGDGALFHRFVLNGDRARAGRPRALSPFGPDLWKRAPSPP